MERDARAYLWDVQQAANAIDQFTAGLDVAGYERNALVWAAVERQFEIIGEALNQLSKVAPDLVQRISDRRQIIGFRNILIHGYAAIDHGRVCIRGRRSGLPIRLPDYLGRRGRAWPRALLPTQARQRAGSRSIHPRS
jgi:uncharacterized protein with HEPN domain